MGLAIEIEDIQRQIARTWKEGGAARALRVKCSVTLKTEIPDKALSDHYFPNTLVPDLKKPPAEWAVMNLAKWEEEIARKGTKTYSNSQTYSPVDASPRPRSVKFFDGRFSWIYEPKDSRSRATRYEGPARVARIFSDYYGDAIGFPSNVLSPTRPIAGDIKEPYQLDQILTTGRYVLLGEETIGGEPCAVLERRGLDKLWLAMGKGYAIVRRDWCWTVNGPLKRRITNRDFQQMRPEVWIPRQVEMEIYGHPSSNPGRRVGVLRLEVIDAEVDVPDSWFEPHFPEGTSIDDTVTGEKYTQGKMVKIGSVPVGTQRKNVRSEFLPRPWWRWPLDWAYVPRPWWQLPLVGALVWLGLIIVSGLVIHRMRVRR
jgi:hypothetical protein